MALRARILGAAAGGGLPQWNCGCENCDLARAGAIPSQTQSSLACTADGVNWVILNASPDIRQQIANAPPLHPTDLRESPVKAVLLTNGDIDHVAGLLTLREKQAFALHATREIHAVLAANPIFAALDPALVKHVVVDLGTPVDIVPGLTVELFAVPGKVPLYLEGDEVKTDLEGEQTVGVHLRSADGEAFYIPGCAKLTDGLRERLKGAGLVFFDGTLWQDDEMIRAGLGQKTGLRMGHISMSGPQGSIAAFDGLSVGRKVFIHMNNTNPVLRPDAPERRAAEAAGWTIARDGMEVVL